MLVQYRQPHAHALGRGHHVGGVDAQRRQAVLHVAAQGGVVHHADKLRLEAHVRQVLRHVAAHPAGHHLNVADVRALRVIGPQGKALDIHKDRTDDQHDGNPLCFGYDVYNH